MDHNRTTTALQYSNRARVYVIESTHGVGARKSFICGVRKNKTGGCRTIKMDFIA